MKEPHEDPEENPAGEGGRSESGPDTDSTGSPESASDPRTVAEQSAPALAALLAARPPRPKALERFVSRMFDDPDDVDAVIQDIEALSGERAQISIYVLESVLLNRLDAQDAKLEAQTKEISSLTAEVRAQGARIDKQGDQLDKQGDQLEELIAEVRELRGETRAMRADIGALGVKLDSAVQELTESIASIRRENRFMMALVAVLIALGIFGWLG